jgi:hypothetical protein
MKIFKFYLGFLLIAGFFSFNQINAQTYDGVITVVDDIATLYLGSDWGLDATNFNYVETSSGNYTLNLTWYLTPGNEFIPNKGTNKVFLVGVFDYNFFPNFSYQFADGEATINKHGRCHIVLHINGSTTL